MIIGQPDNQLLIIRVPSTMYVTYSVTIMCVGIIGMCVCVCVCVLYINCMYTVNAYISLLRP